ncbi:MAG: hypothetical protein ACHQ52_03500, partial [Candidatus Eisenbacteria bacterium]
MLLIASSVGLLLTLAVATWWWAHPPDPATELRARDHPLARLERVAAPELGARVERWRMIAADGDTVSGLWRGPAPATTRNHPSATPTGAGAISASGQPAAPPSWVVVLLGGIGTDDRAALLIPDSLAVGVLAVSWPWKGSRRMGRWEFIARSPAIREAMLRAPAAMARGVAAARHEAPGARVALLGASLGAPPTIAALALTRPDALVIVDGAADLRALLRSETSRALGGGKVAALLAPAAGALAARLVSSLEPERHGAEAHGIPTLVLDAA